MIQDQQEHRNLDVAGPASGMSLRDILRTLQKHYRFIIICALCGALIAFAYVRITTPIYQATTIVRIDPNRANSLGLNDLISSSVSTQDPLKTEAQILRSDTVAIAALQSLPDDQFKELTGVSKAQMGFPPSVDSAQQQEDRLNGRAPTLTVQQENAIMGVLSQVAVKPVEDTQLLSVDVRDKNPEIAATLANHIVFAYLRNSFDSRYSSVAQAQTWLQAQLSSLKSRAADAQKRLASFQEENNIIGTDRNNNTVIERLQSLNSRLAEAQGQRIFKEAQMRAAMNADVSTLATLYPDIGLQALQSQQATLYARYTELSAKFGPSYPPLAEVIIQRKQVDDKLAQLINVTRDRLRQEYDIARQAEDLLQKQFDEQTQRVYALNSKQAELAVLQAEGSASRDLYDRLQYQLEQAGISAGLNGVNTMVVSSARTPHAPVEPRKALSVALGLILGLFSGALSAFAFDTVGDKLQTVSQAEAALNLPVLTTIPHEENLRRLSVDGTPQLPISYRNSASKITEAFRTLRNAIAFSSLDNPPRVILVTSSFAAEGKTTLSANFAVTLAQAGARVLIVDIDLRRARLHWEFACNNEKGLSDLLLGDSSTEASFQHPLPTLPNLTLLTAGNTVQFPSEVLASGVFARLIEKWRTQYDYIVLDSAPLMVVSDTLPVAKHVDAVVLVTRYDRTPIRAAQRSIGLLSRAGARSAGFVINDVPIKGMDYGSYYSYGYGYYSDDNEKKKKP